MGFAVIEGILKQDAEYLLGPGTITAPCGIISHISFDFNRRMKDEVMSKTSHHYNFSH